MSVLNSILKTALKRRIKQIDFAKNHPFEVQQKILKYLIDRAKNTEWGIKFKYSSIKNYNDFTSRVPISTYEDLFPYLDRIMKGQQNILWPSYISWFSKSSGTTNAKSKFIPVSPESLNDCHYKGGKDLLSLYFNNFPKSKLFDGRGIAIGGSYTANTNFNNSYCGDISAVIMANLPIWAQYVRTPDLKTALMSEWEEKLEKIAQLTSRVNVTNISGVPTWTILLLERVLEITQKKNILEVWPNFEVFYHGAVSFTPYKELFKKFFPGTKVNYVETYNASEGFFGLKDTLHGEDLLLMVDYGVFYEFIPLEDLDKEKSQTIPLEDVELNKNYAIVISTNAGLWRYQIGDTIKFTSLSPFRFKITGRTKHFINAFGEELVIENAEKAISLACDSTNAIISNFTAGPLFFDGNQKGGHEWIIEFVKPPSDLILFTDLLDQHLKQVNSDYEAKRYKDLALQKPIIHSVPEGTFYKWMKKRGKLGGQNKVPRLSNSREYLNDILNDLRFAGSNL